MSSNVSVAPALGNRDVAPRSTTLDNEPAIMRLTLFSICCLPILTFTTPGRPSPSSLAFLDSLAIVKLAVLLIVFFGGARFILLNVKSTITRLTLAPLIPFYVYLGWAVFSVLWTPLPAVTVGQAGGLASLLVLASLVGLVSQEAESLERVLKTLTTTLLLFSLFILIFHFVKPEYAGLDRYALGARGDGVVHPTAAGANASLGLLLATFCYFIGRYPWASRMFLLGVMIHGLTLFFASSRMALAMAMVTVPVVIFLHLDNRKRALGLLAAGALAIAFIVIDPAFQSVMDSDSAGLRYITRGQTSGQLREMSGRYEMWNAVWNQYKKSVVIGHGYFVTSETGRMLVWYHTANHTAHNIYLQILVSTGLVGFLIFMTAISRLFLVFQKLSQPDKLASQVYQMLIFIFIWYLGWSLLCVSFMGPVRSESVVFFTFVGIGLAQVARLAKSDQATHSLAASQKSFASPS